MPNIIIKNYEHFNKSLPNWNTPQGVHVKSKSHYDKLCKEAGMVSDEKAKEQNSGFGRKEYSLSNKAKAIISAARASKDKKGNVKLSDKTIDAMRSIGAIGKSIPDYIKPPKNGKGGFYK